MPPVGICHRWLGWTSWSWFLLGQNTKQLNLPLPGTENLHVFFMNNVAKKTNSHFFKPSRQNHMIVRGGFGTLESVNDEGVKGPWSGASGNQLVSVGLPGSRCVWFCKRTLPIAATTEIYKVFVILHFMLRNTITNTHISNTIIMNLRVSVLILHCTNKLWGKSV